MNGWNATEFFRWVKGKKIAFIGVGVTNTDRIRLFAKKGAEVSVLDRKSREQLGALADEFEQSGIRLVLGDGYLDGLIGYDAVFRAPGMYFHHPALEKARQEGAVITSEMELFFRLCPCKTYAVTGLTAKPRPQRSLRKCSKHREKRSTRAATSAALCCRWSKRSPLTMPLWWSFPAFS